MARLHGRVAILIGGAKGIGKHYARALASEGARLMIATSPMAAKSPQHSRATTELIRWKARSPM
jgi:NAD(P)-dependent dehydrogenase (short-subunit alcohol dehydrogenase family)